jgi:hypothetical protein
MDLVKIVLGAGRKCMVSLGCHMSLAKTCDFICNIAFGLPRNSSVALAKQNALLARPIGWQALTELAEHYSISIRDAMQIARSVNGGTVGVNGLPMLTASVAAGKHALLGDGGWYELSSSEAVRGGFDAFYTQFEHLRNVTVWLGTWDDEGVPGGIYRLDHGTDGLDDEPWDFAERRLAELDADELDDEFVLYRCPEYTRTQVKEMWRELKASIDGDADG